MEQPPKRRTSFRGTSGKNGLVRLNADGSFDETFDAGVGIAGGWVDRK